MEDIKIVFISSSDLYGGSSIAAYRLHCALLQRGYTSRMIVNRKISKNNDVIELNSTFQSIIKLLISGKINFPYSYRIGIFLNKLRNSIINILISSGREIFF